MPSMYTQVFIYIHTVDCRTWYPPEMELDGSILHRKALIIRDTYLFNHYPSDLSTYSRIFGPPHTRMIEGAFNEMEFGNR